MGRPALLRLLCALLAPEPQQIDGDQLVRHHGALIRMADAFRVLPGLYLALHRQGLLAALPPEMADALEAAWLLNRARNADLAAQARDLTAVLAEIDLTPVYLKGMAQILGGSQVAGARMTSDLDVLVPEARLPEALLHLQARGWGPSYDSDTPITWMRSYAHHATALRRPNNLTGDPSNDLTGGLTGDPTGDLAWVELHKGFFSDPDYLLPATEVLARARPVQRKGWQAHIPCPDHQVTMAIAHATLRGLAMLGGSASLRDGLDIMALSRQGTVDFTAIESRFRAARASGAYGWYGALLADLFGADAVRGQPQAWPRIARQRARLTQHVWMRPALQRALTPGSLPSYALQWCTDRRFRQHFRLLAFDRTYRAHWRGGEH